MIRIFSFASVTTFLFGLVGIFCGVLYSFGGLIIDILVSLEILSAEAMSTPGLSYGTILAFGALIGMPVIFSCFGFLLGLAVATIYNIFRFILNPLFK